jgi:DNA-binding transcriptional MerR regulator
MSTALLAVCRAHNGADPGAPGFSMPAEAAEKPNDQTWIDWLEPKERDSLALITTRDELLTRLERLNIDVKLSDLRYWEYEGILPRPVRKWDPDVKAMRAYYPMQMVAVIFALRELQAAGLQLRDIAPALRFTFAEATHELSILISTKYRRVTVVTDAEIDRLMLGIASKSILNGVLFDSIVPALRRYARLLNRLDTVVSRDVETLRAEVTFSNATGEPIWESGLIELHEEDGTGSDS